LTTAQQRTRITLSIGFALGIATLLVVGYGVMRSANRFVRTADDVAEIHKVLTTLHMLDLTLTRAESEQRGFLVTDRPEYLSSYNRVATEMAAEFADLRELEKDEPSDLELVNRAEAAATQKIAEMNRVLGIRQTQGIAAAQREVGTQRGLRLMTEFRRALGELEAEEREVLRRDDLANRANRDEARLFLIGGLGFAILTVILSMGIVIKDARRRLEVEALLQESLALQSAIFDSVNAAIFAFDAGGRITSFNRTAERWLGYPADQVIGAMSPTALHDREELAEAARERNATEDALATLTAGPRKHEREERRWTLIRRDGSRFPAIVSYSVLRGTSGEAAGFVGVATDLTEIEEAHRALDAYVTQLEDAQATLAAQNDALERATADLKESRDVALAATRLKSEFLANMSHEIRTPMNGVLGMAHLLLQTSLTERQRTFVRTVQQSAESLLTILNDVLDLSKMEAGKMTLEHFPFDIRTTLEDLAETLAPVAQIKGLELSCDIPPRVPVAVIGDAGRLRQVLTNLLSNAVKFTEKGEVVLSARVVRETRERIVYRFAVRDTGIGIPYDRQERIFESFTQADGSTTRKFGGTGLGLTISRQLCELMGGEIGVRSEFGHGSEFWAEIPFPLRSEAGADAVQEGLRGRCVLVTDDHATNRMILRELLAAWGCDIDEAASGEEAVEKVVGSAPDRYDAIVMDMHMPDMDGAQAARAIREREATAALPIVLLSSMGHLSEETDAYRLFNAILSKPVRSGPLYDALLMAVSGTRIEGEEERGTVRVSLPGVRVLVVEDNAVNQLVAVEMLSAWRCEVETADNGAVAVDAIRRGERYNVVLMDVQMPVMDGLQATREIREFERVHGGHVSILAMTANAMSGDRERCLHAGMDGYLSKPLQAKELLERLAEHTTPEAVVEEEVLGVHSDDEGPVLDLDRLDEACGGKPALKRKVIERYLATSTRSLGQMREAAEAADTATLSAAAHALKGSSLTIGSALVGGHCAVVEAAARAGTVDAEGLAAIEHDLARLHDELGQILQSLGVQS
jgi:PAS domain S-box-containing protein